MIVHVPNPTEMEKLGAILASACQVGMLIFLQGELGAGKTTLVRGFVSSLGHSGTVKSPTYTLVEPYDDTKIPVYHFDLYRLSDPDEIEFLGVRDYLGGQGICLIEWPERAQACLPEPDLVVTIRYQDAARNVTIRAQSDAGVAVLRNMSAKR